MDDRGLPFGAPPFGALLKRHRLATGLSQEALAERARMSTDGISALERGHRRTPQRETIGLLASALGLTEAQRVEFEGAAKAQNGRTRVVTPGSQQDAFALPHSLTAFIGRLRELAEIQSLISDHRLVTIVGAGGIGKTCTALRIGAAVAGASEVRFASLAAATGGTVAHTIAAAIGARGTDNRSSAEAVIGFLRNKRLMLIIDNCEHVIGQAAEIANQVLSLCPNVRILATSREPLKISGERVYKLPSLSISPAELDHCLDVSTAQQFEAISLFADRASAADYKFSLESGNVTLIAEICRRLDGIPLAIELAAARVGAMPIKTICDRLDERFRILTGGQRIALARQQTMHAAIDWSYGLLSTEEQRLFERLSIFVGGCTIAAAEALGSAETSGEPAVLDTLFSLVEKSLLYVDDGAMEARYRLLESTRAFGIERLRERGEYVTLARRHAQWMAKVGDDAASTGLAMAVEDWVRKFEPELENARAAIEHVLEEDDVETAARIACGFTGIWRMNHGHEEPRRWLETLVSRVDTTTQRDTAARVWHTLSTVTFGVQSVAAAQMALDLGGSDDPEKKTITLHQISAALLQAGQIDRSEQMNGEALELCRRADLTCTRRYAAALSFRAQISAVRGDFEGARRSYAEALSLMTALGEEHEANIIRINIGELEYRAQRIERALEFADAALAASRRVGSRHREATALVNLAAYRLTLSDLDTARGHAREALALSRWASPLEVSAAIQHLATVAALQGDVRRATLLCGYVDAWYRNEGVERDMTELKTYEILSAALSKAACPDIPLALATGAQLTEAEAIAEALAVGQPASATS